MIPYNEALKYVRKTASDLEASMVVANAKPIEYGDGHFYRHADLDATIAFVRKNLKKMEEYYNREFISSSEM